MKETEETTIRNLLLAMKCQEDRVEAALAALRDDTRMQPDISDEILLTPAQLRARLGISTTTLWRLKDLPFLTVGARRRYMWSEVEKHLAGCMQPEPHGKRGAA